MPPQVPTTSEYGKRLPNPLSLCMVYRLVGEVCIAGTIVGRCRKWASLLYLVIKKPSFDISNALLSTASPARRQSFESQDLEGAQREGVFLSGC